MTKPVLIVDDDAAIREMLVEILTDEGFPVVAASNGVQALRMLQTLKPAVMLLDMLMPRLDGAALACAYHAMPGPHAPIILLTASLPVIAQQAAAQMRAFAVLSKPVEVASLLEIIHALAESITAGTP